MAALTECKLCFGVEKAKLPSTYAKVCGNVLKINNASWNSVCLFRIIGNGSKFPDVDALAWKEARGV